MNFLDYHFEDITISNDRTATGYAEVEYEIEPADRSVGFDGDVDFTVTSITATIFNEEGDGTEVVLKKGDDLFQEICKNLSDEIGNKCWDVYHGGF